MTSLSVLYPCRSCFGNRRAVTLAAAALAMVASLAASLPIARAELIVQWNFNGPLGGSLLPSTGSGLLQPVGVGSSGFGSGAANGGSSDPERSSPPNFGWQLWGFPAQGGAPGSAGLQARVDTSGYGAIRVAFDLRASGGSARHQQFQYTLDGISFIDFGPPVETLAADRWILQRSFDLAAIAGSDDNPAFGFRLVSAFAPGSEAYQASSDTSNYSSQGTWRFDMLGVSGDRLPLSVPGTVPEATVAVVPLPAAAPLFLAGMLLIWAGSRRGAARRVAV